MHALGDAARDALEAKMKVQGYEYQSDFARKYVAQGREVGREEGLRTAPASYSVWSGPTSASRASPRSTPPTSTCSARRSDASDAGRADRAPAYPRSGAPSRAWAASRASPRAAQGASLVPVLDTEDDMSLEELAELNRALDESWDELEAGYEIAASDVIRAIRAVR